MCKKRSQKQGTTPPAMQNNSKYTDSYSQAKTPNPTLGTIRMVEETLSKMPDYPSKNKLWRALPRQIQYPSFKVILEYLAESNKIMYKDGTIIWAFAEPAKLERLRQQSKPLA
jgi:hypothetical protein